MRAMILGWKEQFIVARKHKVTKPSTFVYASKTEEVLDASIPLRFSVEPLSKDISKVRTPRGFMFMKSMGNQWTLKKQTLKTPRHPPSLGKK